MDFFVAPMKGLYCESRLVLLIFRLDFNQVLVGIFDRVLFSKYVAPFSMSFHDFVTTISRVKGQLISKCLFEKNRLDQNTTEKFDRFCPTVLQGRIYQIFRWILVQTIFSKRHFEIN